MSFSTWKHAMALLPTTSRSDIRHHHHHHHRRRRRRRRSTIFAFLYGVLRLCRLSSRRSRRLCEMIWPPPGLPSAVSRRECSMISCSSGRSLARRSTQELRAVSGDSSTRSSKKCWLGLGTAGRLLSSTPCKSSTPSPRMRTTSMSWASSTKKWTTQSSRPPSGRFFCAWKHWTRALLRCPNLRKPMVKGVRVHQCRGAWCICITRGQRSIWRTRS